MQIRSNVEIPFVNTQELIVQNLEYADIIDEVDLQSSTYQINYVIKTVTDNKFLPISEYMHKVDRQELDKNQYNIQVSHDIVQQLNTQIWHLVDMQTNFATLQEKGGYVNSYMYGQMVDIFEQLCNTQLRVNIFTDPQNIQYSDNYEASKSLVRKLRDNQQHLQHILYANKMDQLIDKYEQALNIHNTIFSYLDDTHKWLQSSKVGVCVKPEFILNMRHQLTALNKLVQDLQSIAQLSASSQQYNDRWKYIMDTVKLQQSSGKVAKEQIATYQILSQEQQPIGVRNQYLSSLRYTQAISQAATNNSVQQQSKANISGAKADELLKSLSTYISALQQSQTKAHVWQYSQLRPTWQISVVDGLSDQLSSYYGKGTKPFQNFHFISSKDIIENTVMINNDTPDTVLLYTPQLLQSWGIIGDILQSFDIFGDRVESPSGQKRMVNVEIQLNPLLDESKRHTVVREKSIGKVPQMRTIVGTQILKREVESQMYHGSIIMLGKPDIKPYDYQFIEDSKTNLFGLFQIRSVSQQFGLEVGYITEITLMPIIHTRDLHMSFVFKVLINTLIGSLFILSTIWTAGQSAQLTTTQVKAADKITVKQVGKQIGKAQINKYSFQLGSLYGAKYLVDSLNIGKYINYSTARVFINEQEQMVSEDRVYFPFDVIPPIKDGKPFLTSQQLYAPTGLYDIFDAQWGNTQKWWNEAATQFSQFFTRDVENYWYYTLSMMRWNT